MEPLEPRLLLAADLAVLDDGGLNDYFDEVQRQLDSDVFSAPIPLIGTQLAEKQAGRIADRISIALESFTIVPTGGVLGNETTTNDVVNALSSSLGSMVQGDILSTTTPGNSEYRFALTLGGSESERIDLDLALGEDALIDAKLGVADEVLLSFDWIFDLTFGVFENDFGTSLFFVDTAASDELRLDNISAVLDGGDDGELAAKGTAGVFTALIQEDSDGAVSQFTGNMAVNVAGGGGDQRLTRFEVADLDLDAVLNGNADINLDIDAALVPEFADVQASERVFNLAIEADALIQQSFVNANTQDTQFGNPIALEYESVRLDLGTFFSEFVDPTVAALQDALDPLKVPIDFLTAAIPVLSDIGQVVGLGKVTPIDLGILATTLDPDLSKAEKEKRLNDLGKAKLTLEFLNLFLDLGPIGEGLPDTSELGGFKVQLTDDGKEDRPDDENDNGEGDGKKKVEVTESNPNTDAKDEIENKTKTSRDFFATIGGSLAFPFLQDTTQVHDMLLGDTTPVLASFGIDFQIGYVFKVTVPIIAPFLNAEFRFDFGATLDFDAGYDLFGANALTRSLDFSSDAALDQSIEDNMHRLADGFFLDDHFPEDAPADLQDGDVDTTDPIFEIGPRDPAKEKPELTITAKLSAGAKAGPDLVVAEFSAGVRVFFATDLLFDLNDLPDPQNDAQFDYVDKLRNGEFTEVPTGPFTYDGRVRIGELDLITRADPFGIFNVSGALRAGLDAFVFASVGFSPFEIVIVDKTFELVNEVIFDFDIFQLPDEDVLAGVILNPPTIGAVDGDGTLTLFMGDTADQRVNTGPGRSGVDNEINEGFSISSLGLTDPDNPDGGETLLVKFLVFEDGERVERVQQRFEGVTNIVAAGGSGNDQIVVDDEVLADVDFSGGSGNDVLSYAGSGVAFLRGDSGNDRLIGGSNNDSLQGGTGDDDLVGGDGNDTLDGGADEDRLDGGLGDDENIGGSGGDTFVWAPGQGADVFVEDPGFAGDTDRLTVGGSFELTEGAFESGIIGAIEASDNFTLSKVLDDGALKVLLESSDGSGAVQSLLIDNIENISIAAGGGSDVVTIGDLTGTDVSLLAIDLSAPQESSPAGETDRVVFSGSAEDDTLTVEGVFASFDQTDLGADPEGGVSTEISREILQLRDQTPGRDSRAFIINSSPDKDSLEVRGLGGNDQLEILAGSQNIDVSDLIDVTLDGGEGDDTLISAFDNATLIGGGGSDSLIIRSDGKVVDGTTSMQLFEGDLLISRVEDGVGPVNDRLSFSEIESLRLELEPTNAGNTLRVVSTIAGEVEIQGSAFDDAILLETLAGNTTLDLNGGDNQVVVGKDGSLGGILGDLQVLGGTGSDLLTFDESASASDTLAQIGVLALVGLSAPGALRYDDAVETLELRLGVGADEVEIADLTRRVIVDAGGGQDSVEATLFGNPLGSLLAPGLITFNAELVDFANDNNLGDTDWLLTNDQLRAGTPGIFDPLVPDFYDQLVLETNGADQVNIALGDGPGSDRLLVWSLEAATAFDLRGGNDAVIVGDARDGAERALINIEAPLVLDAGAGENTLVIDDRANTISDSSGFIDVDSITGFAMGVEGRIDFVSFASLDITLADTDDVVTLVDTAVDTVIRTDATANSGQDRVIIQNASAGATIELGGESDQVTILGGSNLDIDGGDGEDADTIVFDISDVTTPTSGAELGEDAGRGLLTNLGPIGSVAFDDFEEAQIALGQNSDAIAIDNALTELTVKIDGAAGDDTVTIHQIGGDTQITGDSGLDRVVVEIPGDPSAPQHANLFDNLRVDVESLVVDNESNGTVVDWLVSSGVLSGNGVDLLFTDGAEELRILGGSADDSLDFEELARSVDATLDAQTVVLQLGDVVLQSNGFGSYADFSSVVDFDALVDGASDQYTEDGFTLATGGSAIVRDDSLSAAARVQNADDAFTLTEENGGAFALYSVSLASLTPGDKLVTFTGTTLVGDTVSEEFMVEGGVGFVELDLPGIFTSLRDVTWSAVNVGGDSAVNDEILVDNIIGASLVPVGTPAAAPGDFPTFILSGNVSFNTQTGQLWRGSIGIDLDGDLIADDFIRTSDSTSQAASKGMLRSFIGDEIVQFRFAGDLLVQGDATVTAFGSKAISLFAGNNATISSDARFDVSRIGPAAGAGGGAGGSNGDDGSIGSGNGGEGGSGGGSGGETQNEVGQEGTFLGSGEDGSDGESGSDGERGESGGAGGAGRDGVLGGAGGAGGVGGAGGAAGGRGIGAEGGEGGGGPAGRGEGGGGGAGGGNAGGGDAGRAGEGGQNNGTGNTISGGGGGGAGGGGGGGGEGGGGGAGGSGGGGGGGAGTAGGAGGGGGQGGNGGNGGLGGQGGFGGGAIEVLAQGRLVLGDAALGAQGGDGGAATTGRSGGGEGGGPVEGGGNTESGGGEDGNGLGDGGAGGDGGRGGDGFAGGFGGVGGGGAGGTIKLSGTVVDAEGARVDTSGGVGGGNQPVRIAGDGLVASYRSLFGSASGQVTVDSIYEGNGPGGFFGLTLSDNFGVEWTGQIEVVGSREVTFFLGSDDGSELFINGERLIDNGGLHPFQTRSGSIFLTEGLHDIRVIFVEADGFAGISLTYSTGGSPQQLLSVAPRGDDGRFIFESNVEGGRPDVDNVIAQTSSSFDGPRELNPYVASGAETPLIADLAGGAEAYGLLSDAVDFDAYIDSINEQLVRGDQLGDAPSDALAAVVRLDVGPIGYADDYSNHDMLLFINLSDQALDDPELGIVGSPANDFSTDLLTGGFLTDVLFGGSGSPQALDALGVGQIWATLIPDANPGGLATDFINASVSGTIDAADGVGLRDGESFFITAPRPDVGDAAALSGLQGVAVSPDGETLYGINTDRQALVVANADDLGQRQFFQDGVDGVDGLAGASDVTVSADGLSVYVTGSDDGEIAQFDRDPVTGDLTFVGTFSATGGLDVYDAIATSGDGDTVVVGGDDGVVVFDRAGDGSLSQADARNIGDVSDVAVSDDGDSLYAIDSTAGTLIGADASDLGQPLQTFDLTALGVGGASAVTISADGAFVYATGEAGGLAVFARDAGSGDLTLVQVLQEDVEGIRGLAGANDVAASDDNAFVYVTGGSGDSLTVFERNATTGELQFAQILRGREGLESPSALATANGAVFVASEDGLGTGNGGIAAFSRLTGGGETPPLVVEHQGIEELSLRFGGGDDVISQIEAASVEKLTIDAGDGFNRVDLLNLGPDTVVQTGAGNDEISVRSDTPGTLSLDIQSGSGEDSVVVRELVSGNVFTIDLGEDNDTVQIAGEALPAGASIVLDGGDGDDTLLFSAGGMPINPAAPAVPDGTIRVDDPAFGTVTYQSIQAIPGFEPSVADVGGPYEISEGDSLSLDGTATAATNTTIVSTRWDLNGDGIFDDAEGTDPLLSWADLVARGLDDDGRFEISLEVTDSAGNVAVNTGVLGILNTAPEITTGGASAAVVGVPYVLTFAATDPGDDTVTRWEVDWGDGSPREVFASDATSASHVYQTTGTFTPVVVAVDEDGSGSFAGDPATTAYTAAGPTVTVTPPTPGITTVGTTTVLQITEGEGVTLEAVVAGTPSGFSWDLDGDGVFGDEASFGTVNGAEITLTAAELAALGLDDGNADYSIGVQVSFGSGAGGPGVDTAVGIASLTVLNAAPGAQLVNSTDSPGAAVNEGESATVTVVNQSDPSPTDEAAGYTYSYDFDNDGVFEIEDTTDASVVVPGAFLNDAGIQTVRAVIFDKDGGSTELFTGVRVAEVAPTLNVIGADTAVEGQGYDLDLSATDPGDDSIVSWTVDWGDGSGVTVLSDVADLTHVFADSGEFTVTITAQDEDGLYVVEKTVTVANVAPTITVSGPATVEEGEGFVLDLSASDPGDDTIASWTIDWGDGNSITLPGSSNTASHIYADDSAGGSFEVTVTATDEDGSYVETVQVTVENVAPTTALTGVGTPTAQLAGPAPADGAVAVNEGSNFILQIAPPNDPGDDTVTQYSIDWGDGSPAEVVAAPVADENGFIPSLDVVHIYADGDETRTITVTLTDEDGSFVNATSLDVDVRNVAPTIAITGNASVNEGDIYSLVLGDPADPGDDSVVEYIVDWGDGTIESFAAPGEVTHVYGNASGGSDVTISVSLVDEDGLFEAVATQTVTVNAVAPSLEISGGAAAVEGTPYTLNLGDLVDPGSDSGVIPVLEYIVDWGDGTVESFTAGGPVTHSFVDGLFNNLITVDVVTAEGTIENAASLAVQVANAAPQITALSIGEAPLPDLNGDNVIDIFDISIVASSFGADPASSPLVAASDLNGDGVVDMTDINIVLGAFGQSIPPAPPSNGDGGTTTFAAGGTALIKGSLSDLGVADSHEVLIDWGDGTTTVASVTQESGGANFFGRHTYSEAGVYKVTVTAADNDGADAEPAETVAFVTGTAVRDGVLQIVGTGADDSISVTRNLSDPSREQLDIAANFLGAGGGIQTIDVTGLTGAVIYAGSGNDTVSVAEGIALPFLVMGGEGNDSLSSQAASSVILGGAGNDELIGGGGSDVLVGGAGEDSLAGAGANDLLVGGEGDDELDGGEGDDFAFYNGAAADYDVTPGPGGTVVTSADPLLDGDDALVDVEDIIFEDGDDDFSPVTNPWADDVVARLKGPAKDVTARDATWLLFD